MWKRGSLKMARWIRFNVVGAMGAVVQLAVVWTALHLLDLHYLVATVLAVEVAIVHNFLWHALWTFSDRKWHEVEQTGTKTDFWKDAARSFLRFQLIAGVVSMPGNTAIILLLVGYLGMNSLLANGLAIVICSTVNFAAADRFSFRHREPRKIFSRS